MIAESIWEHVYRIIAEIFNVPVEQINFQSSPDTIDNWDSLGHLNLILALEQEFGIRLSPEHIELMDDVGTIIDIMERLQNDRKSS